MADVLTIEGGPEDGGVSTRSSANRVAGEGGGLDFATVAQIALANAENLLSSWLPDGRKRGHEWIARNPTRSDGRAGSFSVNVVTGQWGDFAAGAKGGDLISLRAYLDGTGQGDALRAVAAEVGAADATGKPVRRAQVALRPKPSKPRVMTRELPAPNVEPNFCHRFHGVPSSKWEYRNAAGVVVGYACRSDHPDGSKDVLPLSWDGRAWRWKAMPEPRPLYNLPDLLRRPEAVVLVVEGEKAADAAAKLIPEAVTITWPGGCKAWEKTDWQPLTGRKVILVSDADEPGTAAMGGIRDLLLGLEVSTVKRVELPAGLPPGWDLADALAEGWTGVDALRLLAGSFPTGLCARCWVRNVAAPLNGPTCRHIVGWQWLETK